MKISGIVIKGKQKGRELGFPTVNLALEEDLGVKSGVYAGWVIFVGQRHKSAIFINPECTILEAYIFDFNEDLYGQVIEIEIGKKIREVQKFENEEELKKQIAKDIFIIRNL